MKKLILLLALTLSCATFAQGRKGATENNDKKSPEERVEKQLAKMTSDLALDEKQVATVRDLLLDQAKKRQEKMAVYQMNKEEGNALSREDKKTAFTEMKQNQAEMKEKIKVILNAEQYTKWEKNQDEKREKMIEKLKERRSAR